jgi:hypothetical protein
MYDSEFCVCSGFDNNQKVGGVIEYLKTNKQTNKQTPWPLVRERTIPTERPTLVDEILVPTVVDRGVSRGQRGGSPTAVNLSFLDRSRYFSFK